MHTSFYEFRTCNVFFISCTYLFLFFLNIVSYGDDALLHQDQIKLTSWFPPPKCNAMQIREITWGLQDNSGCSSTYSLDKVYEIFICVLWVGFVSAVAHVCHSCSHEEHLMFSLFGGRLLLLIWVHLSSCSCSFVVLTILNEIPRWLGRMGRKPFNFLVAVHF